MTIGVFLVGVGCRRQPARPGPAPETARIILADGTQPVSAAVYVALREGYFAREGLNVELLPLTSGRDALQAVLDGRAHFATTAETPVVHAVLGGDGVKIVATIASTGRSIHVIARRDRGIRIPGDLRGKRIAVTRGTNAEFYLDLFLAFFRLGPDAMDVVDTKPEEMVESVMSGEVDAAATWQPHAMHLRQKLGENAAWFCEDRIYTWFWNIAALPGFIRENPRTTERLVRALAGAADMMAADTGRARTVVAAQLGLPREALEIVWNDIRFAVSLDQSLLLTLEDQARWLLTRQGGSADSMPNYLDCLYTEALDAFASEKVTVFR